MQSQINVKSTYLTRPSADVDGIIGIKINCIGEITMKPINISLLIDTSGSMEGARIESVKKTIKVLIECLSNDDVITLIGFSSKAKVILSQVTIDHSNRISIIENIEALVADGGTNLESGISALGSLQITNSNAVVILTDGDINEGLCSNAAIYSLVKSYIPTLPIYTLGYGNDHNNELMKTLSSMTRGSYSFIQDEISLPESMGDIVGGLKSELLSNATVKFPKEWKCIEPITEGNNTFSVGSIISNKPMWIMLKVPARSDDKPIEVSYIKTGDTVVNTITFNADDTSLERMELLEQMVRCEMGKIINDVTELMKSNQLLKASEILNKAIESLNISEAKTRHIVIKMKAQIEDILSKVKDALKNNQSTPNALVRLASNTSSNYGNQRGVLSGGGALFTSPMQAQYSRAMSGGYNDEPTNPTASSTI